MMIANAVMKVSGWPAAVEIFAAQRLKNLRMPAVTHVQ
jgi:hypothetical protein